MFSFGSGDILETQAIGRRCMSDSAFAKEPVMLRKMMLGALVATTALAVLPTAAEAQRRHGGYHGGGGYHNGGGYRGGGYYGGGRGYYGRGYGRGYYGRGYGYYGGYYPAYYGANSYCQLYPAQYSKVVEAVVG